MGQHLCQNPTSGRLYRFHRRCNRARSWWLSCRAGYFTALETYFTKTRVFQRDYSDIDPDEVDTNIDLEKPYSGMQTAIFDMLDDAGRLCVWQTEDVLLECAEALP